MIAYPPGLDIIPLWQSIPAQDGNDCRGVYSRSAKTIYVSWGSGT